MYADDLKTTNSDSLSLKIDIAMRQIATFYVSLFRLNYLRVLTRNTFNNFFRHKDLIRTAAKFAKQRRRYS